MTENRLKMTQLETYFEFFNYDALSDDEVQRIKNLLKEPCLAVKLPKFVFNNEEGINKPVAEFKPATPPTAAGLATVISTTLPPSNSSPSRSLPPPHQHQSPPVTILPVEYVPPPTQTVSASSGHYMYPVVTSGGVPGASYMQAGYTLGTNLYMAAPKPMDANSYLMSKMLNNGMDGQETVMDGSGGPTSGGMVISSSMYASTPCYGVYTHCPPLQHHHPPQYLYNTGHAFLTPIAPIHPAAGMRGSPTGGGGGGAELNMSHHQHHHHHHQQAQAAATVAPSPYLSMVPPGVGASVSSQQPLLQPLGLVPPADVAPVQLVEHPVLQPSYDVVVDLDDGESEPVADNGNNYEDNEEMAGEVVMEDEEQEIAYDEGEEVEPDQAIDDGYAEEEHPYADSGDDVPAEPDVEGDEGFLDAALADETLDEIEEAAVVVIDPAVVVIDPASRAGQQVVGQHQPSLDEPEQVEIVHKVEVAAPVAVVSVVAEVASGPKSWASLFKKQAPPARVPLPSLVRPAPNAAPGESVSQPPMPRPTVQQQQPPPTNGVGPAGPAVAPSAKAPTIQSETKVVAASCKEEAPGAAAPAEPTKTSPAFPGARTNGAGATNSNDLQQLGDMITHYQHDFRNVTFLPRGLSNKGNWCYISSTLQALLACPPFYNLLLKLPSISGLKHGKSLTPITDTMVEFIHEFSPVSMQRMFQAAPANSRRKEELSFGAPFEPVYIYAMLSRLRLNAFEGRQEDAEEFLSCLLNGLHDEMCAALNSVGSKGAPVNGNSEGEIGSDHLDEGSLEDENTDDSWQVMEKRNKASVTRTTDLPTSPVSEIFCGKIRSALHSGSVSSATLQPFFTLQLDIQSDNVRSVKDAMQGLVVKESLQGFHCSKTKQEVTASRQMTLEELPPVLILHLKRFIYDKDGGSLKLSKRVDFSIELELNKELLSPTVKARITGRQRVYRLIAVVYHCGGEAGKGHYVADVFHQGSSTWLRADDARLACISENKVLHHPPTCVPYLLFYRRSDTIGPAFSHAGGGTSAK